MEVCKRKTFFFSAVLAISQYTCVANLSQASDLGETTSPKTTTFDKLRLTAFKALENRHYLEAVYILRRCVNLRPNDALSRHYLCVALLDDGDLSQSVDEFKLWTGLNENALEDQLSFVHLVRNKEDQPGPLTIKCLTRLVDNNLGNTENLLSIAKACLQMQVTSGPILKALNMASKNPSTEQSRMILDIRKALYDQVKAAASEKNRKTSNF